MQISEIFKQLYTNDFKLYIQTLQQLRTTLKESNNLSEVVNQITEEDFFYMLRPYYWFMHNPGFQDIYDTFDKALLALENHKDFFENHKDSFLKEDFMNVAVFGAVYLEKGTMQPSYWKSFFRAASIEICASIKAGELAEKFKELNATQEDIDALYNLKNLLSQISGSKHVSYKCLRSIGVYFLPALKKYIIAFTGDDQSFILHALDEFKGNNDVIEFYKEYIEKTPSESLKEEAQKYLSRVLPEVVS